jgi:GNAT superfamily N-acetyltransferase
VPDERTLSLIAEVDGRLVGWLSARLELPHHNAGRQFVREHGWTRLLVDALIVEREQWRRGIGTMLLEAAEFWGRAHGAQVARLDTYAQGPEPDPQPHPLYRRGRQGCPYLAPYPCVSVRYCPDFSVGHATGTLTYEAI